MENIEKIETRATSVRLPVDVLGILERWKEETGASSIASCITNCVRAAAEDEKCITKGEREGKSVLQEGEVGTGVIQIRMPKNRDGLADAFTTLMYETQERIGVNDRISALGVARARIYKLTPEYQARKEMMGENFYSPYEDEKKLAEDLSRTGGGDAAGVRPKGDKTR